MEGAVGASADHDDPPVLRPSSAAVGAARSNAALSGIRWSDGITKTIAAGIPPRREAGRERHRGQGVATLGLERDLDLRPRPPPPGRRRETATRPSSPRSASPNARRFSRSSVRWNGEAPPRIGTCCLAKSRRDTGQSRDPVPPHMIAGTIGPAVSDAVAFKRIGDERVMSDRAPFVSQQDIQYWQCTAARPLSVRVTRIRPLGLLLAPPP